MLSDRLGLTDRELVSIVGAGGKSTALLRLGEELAPRGRVVLTTTTKMGRGQATDPSVWSSDPQEIVAASTPGVSLFAAAEAHAHKVTGLSPATVDAVFADPSIDFVIVEADGARSRRIKAPADHEPVIPSSTTTAVVVASLGALGHRIDEVAHRPELVAAILSVGTDHVLAAADVAGVLLHPSGGLKSVPRGARAVIVLTGDGGQDRDAATELGDLLRRHERIDRVVLPMDG